MPYPPHDAVWEIPPWVSIIRRRRRRSRSVSPGRGFSKRARSRSRDRRGRNTGAARDANRIVDVPRRDKRLRDDRRMTRSRER